MLDTNPLLNTGQLPSFSTIRTEHLVPAIEYIIADSRTKIADIIASQTPFPTWDDLVLAVDEVKTRLEEAVQVIAILSTVNTQQAWRDAASLCDTQVTQYLAQLAQDPALFELYQALANSPIAALFDRPRTRVLQKTLQAYRQNGLHLAPPQRQRLGELKAATLQLEQTFNARVAHATAAWGKHLEDESLLAGLSVALQNRLAVAAQQRHLTGWWLSLDDDTFRAVMLHAEHRPLRQEMWLAHSNRATAAGVHAEQTDNDEVLAQLLEKRHQTALLLGHKDYAELAQEDRMATSADHALGFLRNELESRRAMFALEERQLEEMAEAHDIPVLEPWDYEFVAQKVREAEGPPLEAWRDFFVLPTVLSRLILLTRQLFGVELVEREAFDRWHPQVRLFEVTEHQQTLGYLFVDLYGRGVNDEGVEVLTLRNRQITAEGRPRFPVAVLRGHFAQEEGSQPSLLGHTQLRMLMHEFGHCLQQLLTEQPYSDVSGIRHLALDAMEFVGQVMEQWCLNAQFLTWLSEHYQTGERLPVSTALGFVRAASTQTSWATAHLLLLMLFDIEVHRARSEGRSAAAVFEALSTEVAHVRWPHGVRPYNSYGLIASPLAAQGYSYKGSGVMASLAFDRLSREGLFDAQAGRAFRSTFLARGDAWPLRESLDAFLGSDAAGRLYSAQALQVKAASSAEITALISQLSVSQQHMILLNDAVPRPSDVISRFLNAWFAKTFPTQSERVTVLDLSIRKVQETVIPLAERVPGGPLFSRTVIATTALLTLLLQAAAGRLSIGELFLNLEGIEIVLETDGALNLVQALNTSEAKVAFERLLIETRPVMFEQLWQGALNDFWASGKDFTQHRPVNEWLADELRSQLMAHANLKALDGGLAPAMHKVVTDYALSAPDASARAVMSDTLRPGVYQLAYTPARWRTHLPVRDCVVLTHRDNSINPGACVLWCLGEPLEVFHSLAQLKSHLIERGQAVQTIKHWPLEGNFLEHQVAGLRDRQKTTVLEVLRDGPYERDTAHDWLERLDTAADIGERLDLAVSLNTRAFHQTLDQLDEWLRGNPHATGKDRLAWWKASREWQMAVADLLQLPPDPVTLATPEAIAAWTRTELAYLMKGKYPSADPDQVFLTIEKKIIDPHAPTGTSPYGSGVSLSPHKGSIFDRRSLTQWAISNLTPDESNARDYFLEGPLDFNALRELVAAADIGSRLAQWLTPAARRTEALWRSLKARQLRTELWTAHLSGELSGNQDNASLKRVLAALDGLHPQARLQVNGHNVGVYQLKWGPSTLRDVLVFAAQDLENNPCLTLYTPGAQDGRVFREVQADASSALLPAVVQTLTATPAMTLWLISKLPLADQADQIASLESPDTERGIGEKITHFLQGIFAPHTSRPFQGLSRYGTLALVDNDWLEALYDTQIAHGLNAVEVLTVSHAERDSEAAQEGRRKGVTLLLGMLSTPQTHRFGGLLGRAILPTMIGGAAVSSIRAEGGSASRWLSDFIGAMGEVVVEAGEDLIMNRAGRRGDRRTAKRRMLLTPLAPMEDAELRAFRVEGLDISRLQPQGRDLYLDRDGQVYAQLDGGFYKSNLQGGERFVYSPRNISNARKVVWEQGRWQAEAPGRLPGGGPVMSFFRTPETPQQKKYNALLEAYLINQPNPPRELLRQAGDTLNAMPDALAQRLLDESIIDARVSGIEAFRSLMGLLRRQRTLTTEHKAQHDTLVYKLDLWSAVHASSMDFEARIPGMRLSDVQKIKMFDTALPYRNAYYQTSGMNIASMPDNVTGAVFIGISPRRGKKRAALDKINKDYNDLFNAINQKTISDLQAQFPGQGPQVQAAIERYFADPENIERHKKANLEQLREQMKARRMPGLLTEIRNKGIPYFVAIKGVSQRAIMLATSQDFSDFSSHLSRYTDTFEVHPVTQATSHKVSASSATSSQQTASPAVPAATERFTVTTSPLADTQMSYDNFPEAARIRLGSIMEDIRAGRATTKRIQGYYWYDLAQLNPGSGRGAWRAAFQRKGDTWQLQGFYDYHTDRPATVWGS